MQLSIKATGQGAKMLSYLLAKNPENLYDRMDKGWRVRLTYTVFADEEVEVILFVTPDPIELVKNTPDAYDITQYINDREFAVSSLFCSYARSALGTALNGRPKEEYLPWAKHAFDLNIGFGPVASDLADGIINELFESLGYQIQIERGRNDYDFMLKEESSARFLNLQGTLTLQNALQHLYVLIPVLDNYKHYYIDERELEKLERHGGDWLEKHPLKEIIIKRTLRFRELIDQAASKFRIANAESIFPDKSLIIPVGAAKPGVSLNQLRYQRIVQIVEGLESRTSIIDFGAGEGKLSVQLGFISGVKEILAVEPTQKELLRAIKRFAESAQSEGFNPPTPVWGSLYYYDEQLRDKDVMILCEVIEHLDESRLPKVMDTLLGTYRPGTLIVTTPNGEYNVVYKMDEDTLRHKDHRFEWSRAKFSDWSHEWGSKYRYDVELAGIGETMVGYGQPSQIAIFTRQVGNQDE